MLKQKLHSRPQFSDIACGMKLSKLGKKLFEPAGVVRRLACLESDASIVSHYIIIYLILYCACKKRINYVTRIIVYI